MRRPLVQLATSLVFATVCAAAHAADCAALKNLKLEATTIDTAEAAPATKDLPALCRVTGVLHPSSDSDIKFEVWMPQDNWNGRYLGAGNGGFAGSIDRRELAAYVKRGFAAAGSDAGHEAEGTDATFAVGHPEKLKDFGWRAVHETVVHAKEIIAAYYGKPQAKAYFDACSDGGREALMEAERFPDDYDGILAGAPANEWSTMLAAGVDAMQALMNDPRSFVPPRKLPAIEKAALAQCDSADGAKDGVIGNPEKCAFDPSVLLCKGADTKDCLTQPQIDTVKKLYAGFTDKTGKAGFPGFSMGDETGWREWVVGESPGASLFAQFVQNEFRYIVTGDPKWNPLTADVNAMLQLSREKTAADLDSANPDLSKFAARGGKLILYHGWSDAAISPHNTVHFYKSIQKTVGEEKAAGFVRLYMVPGMEHCYGGPGASAFGQLGISGPNATEYGVFDSLVHWVEKGSPDESIVATKFDAAMKPVLTRPLCAYPKVPQYKGSGDINDASSFACVAP